MDIKEIDSINSFLDFSKICRFCLNQDLPLTKIFTEDDNFEFPTSLSSKIIACTTIEVEPEDGLPDKICTKCLEQIENWVSFKALCDNSNSLLLQYATGITPISDEVLQKNLQACTDENLDIPSTPAFSLVDVSLLDNDSLLQNIDDSNEGKLANDEAHINCSFSMVLNKSNENRTKSQLKEIKSQLEEDKIKEDKRSKWREKFARNYGNKYDCDLCSQIFTKFSKLLEHDRVDHKDVICERACPQCSQIFISEYRLEIHQSMKHKEKLYSCDMCECKSVSKKSLEVHKLKHSGRFVCDVCGAAKSSARSLQDHLRSHSAEKLFTCDTCQRSFKQRQSIEHHLKTHNPRLQPEFKCSEPTCSKKIKSTHSYNTHKIMHSSQNGTMCEICGKCFKNKSCLYIHKLKHEEKKHDCSVCDKKFSTKNLLNRHLQTHIPPSFVCPECSKTYNRADTLKMHIKSHSSSKPFSCSLCNVYFSLNKYLKQHIAKVHNKDISH